MEWFTHYFLCKRSEKLQVFDPLPDSKNSVKKLLLFRLPRDHLKKRHFLFAYCKFRSFPGSFSGLFFQCPTAWFRSFLLWFFTYSKKVLFTLHTVYLPFGARHNLDCLPQPGRLAIAKEQLCHWARRTEETSGGGLYSNWLNREEKAVSK